MSLTVSNTCWSARASLATVKRRKLAWYGNITRHDSLCKAVLQGKLEVYVKDERRKAG
ncbi:hypothetical protein DPMN_077565 [Dreissena polymorpha]|uniref:Uncharacterized protein n=1 Tax=Dreissena polymorpha TaxID=45954 RepID=A0A9D4BPR2_DREPO|nr:hypothetical protein DPMN_077565 [Dreissena polymorpha]